jgi:hypothetical protein
MMLPGASHGEAAVITRSLSIALNESTLVEYPGFLEMYVSVGIQLKIKDVCIAVQEITCEGTVCEYVYLAVS